MNVQLVAIQLAIDADVLASADTYRQHLEAAIAAALDRAGGDARLVVFPEVAGHLALYALAPARKRNSKTLAAVLANAAVRRPLDVLRGVVSTRLLDARHAVLAAIAPDGEQWWKSVFGPLAKKFGAYIVAGSYLRLAADGALTNASPLFGPDGFLLATTDKVNLVPGVEDGAKGGLGLHRGDPNIPILTTTFGRLATLIGYDAHAEPYTPNERFVPLPARLDERGGVDVVANPAANPTPFQGRGPSPLSCARYTVTAHLACQILDQSFAGVSEIMAGPTVLARATNGTHVTTTVSC